MILKPDQVVQLYRRLAPHYDNIMIPLQLFGLESQRRQAIERLALKEGDVVLDLGCGTGLNLSLLSERVGESGQVIAVDLSSEMLEEAGAKTRHLRFNNVTLIQGNMLDYEPPVSFDAVLSTYALEMVPEYDRVIKRMAHALNKSGRFVALGLKHPESWPTWLVELSLLLARPFKVSRAYESIRPFDSIRTNLEVVEYQEFLTGAAYLCVGLKS